MKQEKKTATNTTSLTTKFKGIFRKKQHRKGTKSNNNQIKYAYCREGEVAWVFDLDLILLQRFVLSIRSFNSTSKCVCSCKRNSFHFISVLLHFFSRLVYGYGYSQCCRFNLITLYSGAVHLLKVLYFVSPFAP